jgi:glycine cleavage system H protein
MNIPENLKYTKDHEWCLVEGDMITIGVTDFAQSELGDIVFVEVETEGEEMDRDEVFGSIEAVKTVSDLFMPVAGEIVQFNEELEANPELVNSDPYGEGWMIKVKMTDKAGLEDLMSSEAYKEMIGK